MSEVIVSMKGICKSFPGVKALDDVSFELRSGKSWHCWEKTGRGNLL